MFDLLTEFLKALAPWPIIQFTGFCMLAYFGIGLIRKGERDKPPSDATPRWFANEQSIEVLRDIKSELRQHTQLLEQIANENVINPRRLQE